MLACRTQICEVCSGAQQVECLVSLSHVIVVSPASVCYRLLDQTRPEGGAEWPTVSKGGAPQPQTTFHNLILPHMNSHELTCSSDCTGYQNIEARHSDYSKQRESGFILLMSLHSS